MTVLGVGIETAILTDCHCYHDDVGEPVIMVSGDYYSTVCNIVSIFVRDTNLFFKKGYFIKVLKS